MSGRKRQGAAGGVEGGGTDEGDRVDRHGGGPSRSAVTAGRGERGGTNRAVAPVVGVAIMISLTVILGAMVGASVTDMGTNAMKPTEPTVAFDFQFNDTPPGQADELTVTHEAGATIEASSVTFVVSGAEAYDHPSEAAGGTCSVSTAGEPTWRGQASGTPDTVQAGSTVRLSDSLVEAGGMTLPAGPVCDGDGNMDHVELNGATVKIVWTSDTRGVTYVVGEWHGPAA